MNIKRYVQHNNGQKIIIRKVHSGGVSMAVLAKPMTSSFVVKSEKVDEFLKQKRNESKISMILNRAKRIEKNIGSIK